MAILLSLRGSVATAAIPWSKVRSICFSLFRWDSSLSLKMTYKKYVILSVAKYPTTKEKSIYRLLFRWDSSLSFRMTYQKKYVILSVAKYPTTKVKSIIYRRLFRWDSSLSFRMTCKKVRHIERSEISHDQSEEHHIPPTYSVGFFTIVQNDV